MARSRVKSIVPAYVRGVEMVFDLVLNNTAVDIIRLSKEQVPHDTGILESSGNYRRKGIMKYEVAYNESGKAPYARRWEFETPKHGFKKGRKSRYLRDPAHQFARSEVLIPQLRMAASKLKGL